MIRFPLIKILIGLLLLMLLSSASSAQEKTGPAARNKSDASEEAGRIFDIKVPSGFEKEPGDEPAIYKWKKGEAEIFVVVGELFSGTAPSIFEQLFKAAEGNKDLENVRMIKLKGGHAFTYTEKTPKGAGDRKILRLIVITENNVINADFSAPEKDFESVLPEFESVLKSFKLKSPRS